MNRFSSLAILVCSFSLTSLSCGLYEAEQAISEAGSIPAETLPMAPEESEDLEAQLVVYLQSLEDADSYSAATLECVAAELVTHLDDLETAQQSLDAGTFDEYFDALELGRPSHEVVFECLTEDDYAEIMVSNGSAYSEETWRCVYQTFGGVPGANDYLAQLPIRADGQGRQLDVCV